MEKYELTTRLTISKYDVPNNINIINMLFIIYK
jgi:hypothetical protein